MKQPIGKLAALGLAALGAAASVRAEIPLTPAYTAPTLEITVADGETTLDDWLAANGKTLDGVQTLVKKGVGRLSSTNDISATFGGDIVIEAGVFSASRPGALGADTGAVYVKDGAQYLVDPADGYENATFLLDGKPLVVAGRGPDNGGAIRHMSKYYVTRALGDVHLTDDALLVIAGRTGDIRHSQTISCYGKTLTVRSPSSPRWGFLGNSWVSGLGRFEADCVVMFGGEGGFTNGVEVVAGRELQSWGWGDKGHAADSTLRVPTDGSKWRVSGGRGLSDTLCNRWNGPVQLDGPLALTKYESNETATSVVLSGPVHGVGALVSGGDDMAGLRDAYTHLHLMNGANDFRGGVVKVGGSVNLYADGALPRDGGALVLSNSVVTLHGDGAWSLPELHVVGTGLVSTATAVVPNVTEDPQNPTFSRGSLKRVVKEGAGELVVNSAYATPLLDVREGTVTLGTSEANAYGPAGLVAGYHAFDSAQEMNAAFASEELYATGVVNRVTISDTQPGNGANFNPQYAANSFWTYSGYIWNRAKTAQTWTFLLKQNSKTQISIDGEMILEQEGKDPKVVQKEMAPGAHRFVLRMVSGNGWAGTALGSVLWADRMKGFCIDFNGGAAPELKTRVNDTGTTESYYDLSAYTWPKDDGSGALFTLTADPLVQAHAQLAVGTLRGCPGAVVDANGVEQQVDELVGYPTVTNGGLRVASAYRLDGAMAPGCAKVDGTLTFAEGCVFSVDDAKALRQGVRTAGLSFPRTIAEAAKVVGCPVPASAEWAVSVDATGTKLILDRKGPGLLLLIR